MRRFAALYERLDRTRSTNAKVAALTRYFAEADPGDAAWALFFLTGRRFKRLVSGRMLWTWTRDEIGLPDWLLGESYAAVGDMAEAAALLLERRGSGATSLPLHAWVEGRILPLRDATAAEQARAVKSWWRDLEPLEVLVLNKLLTGEFRVGMSATLVIRALAGAAARPPATIAHRLMGEWEPTAAFFVSLMRDEGDRGPSHPYPFFLAAPLEDPPESLGPRSDWLVEWKWDGIRAQLVCRQGQVFLWSRGEELITTRFPEIETAARGLDEVVLDGEVLAFRDGSPLSFSVLQRRIGRQRLTPAVLARAPAVYLAFDLLESGGEDLRERPLAERRARLDELLRDRGSSRISASPLLDEPDWPALARARERSRERGTEGLMLKRLDSAYGTGRRRGPWWKWKIEPHTVDAVMIYAHPGHGKRASLFTDYTFAVWDRGELVPVARAYSGLSDEEIRDLDRWIRAHTKDRFGPVRSVEPVQVFELAFEAIAPSDRHRSKVALRFPRILRWRTDKTPEQADKLDDLIRLLKPGEAPPPTLGL